MDLREVILNELLTDDSSTDSGQDSERIRRQYEVADGELKAVLDDVFISLTGFGLRTLIEKACWQAR